MMHNPILSICIPTYNRGTILYNTLRNIIEYKGAEIEIVVSDNASTDDTNEIVNSLQDERIQYYKNESNLGFVYNLIKVIEKAKGNYVFLLSDEDDINITSIDIILETVRKERDASVILGAIKTTKGKYYHKYNDEIISVDQEAFIRYGFTHQYMSGMVLNAGKIDFVNIWKEYKKPEHGYLDVYPQVYILNCLLFKGKTITLPDVFVTMRDKGDSEMDKFDNRPYVHPVSRINLFQKNALSLHDYPLKKNTYIQMVEKLYLWAYSQIYAYYEGIRSDNKYKRYFNIEKPEGILSEDLINLKKKNSEILSSSALTEKDMATLKRRIYLQSQVGNIKRCLRKLLKKLFVK